MISKYQQTRNTRRESRTLVGRTRAGKLAPALALAVRPGEGGIVSQTVTLELDPIAGRMTTPITGEIVSVMVPVQAIDALKDPLADYPGMTEVLREKMRSGAPLFGLENETEISKRLGVNPRSIGGVKKVNEMARLAYICAVNHLRMRKYVKAVLLLASETGISPAVIGMTVLERLNGVLDPEDRVNGAVQLDLQAVNLPIKSDQIASIGTTAKVPSNGLTANPTLDANGNYDWTSQTNKIWAEMGGVNAGNVSLTDFYNAQKMDTLVREMRQLVDDNPQYGEEMVLSWAHGLSIDTGKVPFVIAERSEVFGRQIVPATDSAGVVADTMRSDMMLQLSATVPIPKTELGGIIITMITVRPDETLASQPHPFLSEPWGADNFVADELSLDPVAVTIRDLYSDCTAGQESTVALWTGLNALKQTYIHYGLNRHLDPNTVENKTAIWQLQTPLSVTPESVLYPAVLDHYPFSDTLAEVVRYQITANQVMQTPMIIGPTPVEELATIETADVFDEIP